MNQPDISNAKNPDLQASYAALQRAATSARYLAIQTNTSLVLIKNGELIKISAEQLRREIRKP